jgi:hypothetical protein
LVECLRALLPPPRHDDDETDHDAALHILAESLVKWLNPKR